MSNKINIRLKVWRQKSSHEKGYFESYEANGIDR